MKIGITLEEEYEQASLVTLAIDAYWKGVGGLNMTPDPWL
jgi:hypothetical protein